MELVEEYASKMQSIMHHNAKCKNTMITHYFYAAFCAPLHNGSQANPIARGDIEKQLQRMQKLWISAK